MAQITMSDCGRYTHGGSFAAVAREHLWRDVLGFITYHTYMAIPGWLPFGWFTWMLPTVGDWSERDARWTFAMERACSTPACEPREDGGAGK